MSITREFLRSPRLTGAIAPSSPALALALAQAMTAGLDLRRADVVVELGSGTGAILRRLAPGARLIAVELNPAFASPAHGPVRR
ncbi:MULTISPECIES: hypothetical protein [unclassified Streptomyces]|uniref:hypothetical protein n=1 Tax=unclassified Streptomyces TaxID=2593676 RepID=UPI00224DE113|nr:MULTISPECIES: hypothetical protein [unclassified Streptomyces]MCX5328653.1 hypothetical protein [Streptomyces sp. NBC_00140]MCX5358066.1 hypothetical protein [Streptomyces sp. NBC_00124]